MKRYAVVPTRDRPEKYEQCVASIRGQVDDLITVAHMGAPYAMGEILRYDEDPPNISRMWNLGLDRAASLAQGEPHLVAVLNDDVEVAPGWFALIEAAMERGGTVLGSGRGRTDMIDGAAFVLRGGTLRPSEEWSWWASDNYLYREAVERWGGVSHVHAARASHRDRRRPTGALRARAFEDLHRWRALTGDMSVGRHLR